MEDLIYRQDAIDTIESLLDKTAKGDIGTFYNKILKLTIEHIKKIPSVQSTVDVIEVIHGKWIKTTIAEPCGTDELHMPIYRDRETVKCSECGNPSPIYNIEFEFCPRCGAKMDGERWAYIR